MKLYQRYLLQPTKLFLPLLVGVLTSIYLLVEFFEKLEDILAGQVPKLVFFKYLLFKVPEILYQIWPMALSLALLSALAYLSRGYELLALRSLGFSALKILRPYLFLALGASFLVSGFLALTLPPSSFQAIYTWEVEIKGQRPQKLLSQGELFFAGPDFLLWAKPLEPGGELLADFFWVQLEKARPVRLLYASRARFLGKGRWLLERGLIEERQGEFAPRSFAQKEVSLAFSPSTLLSVKRPLKALTFRELWQRYQYLKPLGPKKFEPLAEMVYRLGFPFWGLLLSAPALLAFLSARGRRATAKGLSLALLILILLYASLLAAKIISQGTYGSPLLTYPFFIFLVVLSTMALGRRLY